MTRQSIVGDSAPTKHVLRVEWFQRDPGGTTVFVSPPREPNSTPSVDRNGDAANLSDRHLPES
jgi:hypothetical protein